MRTRAHTGETSMLYEDEGGDWLDGGPEGGGHSQDQGGVNGARVSAAEKRAALERRMQVLVGFGCMCFGYACTFVCTYVLKYCIHMYYDAGAHELRSCLGLRLACMHSYIYI